MKSRAFCLIATLAFALVSSAQSAPQQDSATFDPDGTAHVTRVIPVPPTVSSQAQKFLISLGERKYPKETLAERRAHTDAWRARDAAEAEKLYPAHVEETTMGVVRVAIITPLSTPAANRNLVLINLHGGGFNSDSGSLIEGVPIANLAKIKVVSVYYRLAPEHPFPAAVDDAVAVYKELLKTHKPRDIGLYGTSAGGILTAEVAVKLKQLHLPLPGALGLFTMLADFSQPSDSREIYTLNGFGGNLQPSSAKDVHDEYYVGQTNPKDPVLSPIYADLHGFPPSLSITSTRDALLSDTCLFHRALLRAGDDAQLVVFEALPHAFWYNFQLPESSEALQLMAKFFDAKLKH